MAPASSSQSTSSNLAGKAITLTEATLSGSELTWRAEGVRFSGRVEGAKIVGELVDSAASRPVTFIRTRSR